ncbi:S8 family peptidase [Alkalihalophilus lindianensis]|uniref:S8 family peptidase n=1 Tax=Alkalihalophilus lindianensis TaxID=1630542 RepID=A0ABU3XAU8_9BACI|nr:S8 family peptidase [Alkalihalophilus lindianensis]MDV2684423.1 S8 family peptidase [Alkalihalophilus lindianensis]
MENHSIKAIPVFEGTYPLNQTNNKALEIINVKSYWDQGIKGKGITIAILDSGCDDEHLNLATRITDGANFTEEDEGDFKRYHDYNGHGTHVAGIACSNNETGRMTSVAPEAKLLVVKVLNKSGSGSIKNLINGIYYAVNWRGKNNERVRVMCLSLGTAEDNRQLYAAIKFAISQGIVVVAASGNQGTGNVEDVNLGYPGAYNEVIQVGAVDVDEKIAEFSNLNNQMDILAPGVNINSTYLDNSYRLMSGTSMAAPFVAGAVSLLIQDIEIKLQRTISETEIYAQLMKRTKSLGYPINVEGNGLIYLSTRL